MSHPRRAVRALSMTLLMVAIAGAGGCAWLRGESGYEKSPESRPLEIPPELDRPPIDPAMNIPEVAGQRSPGAAAASAAPFVIADSADSVWRRVGLALERIEGVTVTERAELLSAYGVRFDGEEFLIRVSAEGDGSRVSAATAAGAEAGSAAAARLLGLLKQRLG